MKRRTPNIRILFCPFVICFVVFFGSCKGEKEKNRISASGTIEAVEVAIASKLSGQVEKILFLEGDQVKIGETLAVIDSSSLEIQLNQAEAGTRLAEAQLQLLLKGARSEDIRQAEEALKQAEANLSVAEEDWKRLRTLAEKESATQKQRDDAEARYKVALAQHETAQQVLQKARQLARPEEIQAARARLDQAAAARDLIKKSIADSTILSPVSGIVTHKIVEAGEFVMPGSPLLTVANLANVHLEIYVPEKELGRVRLGQSAEVKIDSYPDRVFVGKVIFISPEAEFTPKNVQTKEERVKLVFRIKIEVPNPGYILKPGMPADAVIKIEPSDLGGGRD
jgi:HlyD family secretion protein